MSKKKNDKTSRLIGQSLARVLTGETSWSDEVSRLAGLGAETGDAMSVSVTSLQAALPAVRGLESGWESSIPAQDSPLFGALVEVLAAEKAAGVLVRLGALVPGGEGAKTVGAALHRLKMAGVEIPTLTVERTSPRVPEIFAGATYATGGGQRVLSIYWPEQTDGELYSFGIEEGHGLSDQHPTGFTLNALKREIERNNRNAWPIILQITPGHAHLLLAEAIQNSRRLSRQPGFEALYLLKAFQDAGVSPELPLESYREVEADVSNAVLYELVENPLYFAEMMTLDEALQWVVGVLLEQRQVVGAGESQWTQFEAQVTRLIEEKLGGTRRATVARHFEELASWFHYAGRLQNAIPGLIQTAAQLRTPERALMDIPLAAALIQMPVMLSVKRVMNEVEGQFPELQDKLGGAEPTPDSGSRLLGPDGRPIGEEGPRIILP